MNSEQKNMAYWFGLPLWPLDAACRLVCGADPNNPDQSPLHLSDPATRPDWVNLFHHATADDEVEIIEGKGGARGVKPAEFLAWARSKGYSVAHLIDALPAAKGGAVPTTPAPAAKAGTNKKKWGDAELRALWEESIMPGVTQASLATKHGVKRQRIAALIKTAKGKFSTTRTNSGMKNSYGQLIK